MACTHSRWHVARKRHVTLPCTFMPKKSSFTAAKCCIKFNWFNLNSSVMRQWLNELNFQRHVVCTTLPKLYASVRFVCVYRPCNNSMLPMRLHQRVSPHFTCPQHGPSECKPRFLQCLSLPLYGNNYQGIKCWQELITHWLLMLEMTLHAWTIIRSRGE